MPLGLAVTLLLAACGGGGAPAAPPATASYTPIPPPPTLRPAATATPALVTPGPTTASEAKCPDPYPDGAPYEPTPGEPLRLLPTGDPPAVARYRPMPLVRDPGLEWTVLATLGEEREHFAVIVKNLADGLGVALDPEREFYAASIYKTWVMLELYNQVEAELVDLDERYVVSDFYEAFSLNEGELELCEEVRAGDALARMMGTTDNVAANVLLERVGAGNINRALRSLGLEVSGFFPDGTLPTTAADTALLLESIARERAVNEDASESMLALLLTEGIDDRLPALLPEDTEVAHKTGNWADATHDAGIVFSPGVTYVMVVLSDYGYFDDGSTPIAELSRAVYDYYNPE